MTTIQETGYYHLKLVYQHKKTRNKIRIWENACYRNSYI